MLTKLGALGVVFVALTAISFWQIYAKVDETVGKAMEMYDGDAIKCLHCLAVDESAHYVDRNDAIYALGQIGSKRSLPVLETLDTEVEQEKPWDRSQYIVQYEVEKAIHQMRTTFIVTRWMYSQYR